MLIDQKISEKFLSTLLITDANPSAISSKPLKCLQKLLKSAVETFYWRKQIKTRENSENFNKKITRTKIQSFLTKTSLDCHLQNIVCSKSRWHNPIFHFSSSRAPRKILFTKEFPEMFYLFVCFSLLRCAVEKILIKTSIFSGPA